MSDLVEVGRLAIGQHEFGLTEAQSRRLRGESADEVRSDAAKMRRELGLDPPDDPPRHAGTGRFVARGGFVDMNRVIRAAAGRQ